MIGTAPAISPDRDTDQRLNREFPQAQVTGFRNLRHQLVESRINIIGKLHLYNRFCPHSAHPHGGSDNISFLDSRIEDPVITELLSQGSSLPENASQPAAYILPV